MNTEAKMSPDQQIAHDAIMAWLDDWWKNGQKQVLTLGGYAGAGKSYLASVVTATLRRKKPSLKFAFIAYTGKAASVLKKKLQAAQALRGDHVGTIHSLIYKPQTDINGRIIGWTRAPSIEADVLLLDEASMAGEDIFNDLKSYGKPILAIGDHGQLPPIQGTFNLMAAPELRLEHIHRQALDNPIIKAAMMAREGLPIPACDWGAVVKTADSAIINTLGDLSDVLFLCSTNRMRVALNARIREKLGRPGKEPVPGDKIICLKNEKKMGIFNGQTGVIREIGIAGPNHYHASVDMDGFDAPISIRPNKHQFGAERTFKGGERPGMDWKALGQLYDFGNAITTHKAQGSERATVVVFDECGWMDAETQKRWRYTSYTRASERLVIIGR